MKRSLIASAAILALSALVLDASLAAGSGKPPPKVEAANNLSFPLILSDGVGPTLPGDAAWRFATITNFGTQCIGEEGVTPGTPVDPNYLCYYGRRVTVVPETGEIQFTEPTKVWWLQKRPANFWKALTVAHDPSTPLVVSAVDVGDLLESSPAIGTRRIRVEFNMLQHVATTDPEFGPMVVPSWNIGVPSPCVVPSDSTTSIGCFAAVDMSGAVPGTEQSGNEIQGTDFGPGGPGGQPGSRTLIDPATVRTATPDVGGIQALVYSRCARVLIQKVTGVPIWLPDLGRWNGKSLPVVDAAAYTDELSVEITSSGSIVYGYNWNAKTVLAGTYRLTFVLDGNDGQGPQCTTPLATRFDRNGTALVNIGENNQSQIFYAGESGLGDEGGLVYVDITLTTKDNGAGGGGRKGGGGGGGGGSN